MGKQFFVVEVIDANGQFHNEYVQVDGSPEYLADVARKFQRLREDGAKLTGTLSRAVQVNGEFRRIERFEGIRRFANDGFRTMSAFLRS